MDPAVMLCSFSQQVLGSLAGISWVQIHDTCCFYFLTELVAMISSPLNPADQWLGCIFRIIWCISIDHCIGSWSVCGRCGFFPMSNSFLLFIRLWLLVKGRKRRRSRSSVWVLRWLKEKMYLEFATSSPPSMTPLSTSPTSPGSKFTFNISPGQHILIISVAKPWTAIPYSCLLS